MTMSNIGTFNTGLPPVGGPGAAPAPAAPTSAPAPSLGEDTLSLSGQPTDPAMTDIDPTTGLPMDAGMIDPTTGMPLNAGMVDPTTGMPLDTGMVDPTTGMPLDTGMIDPETGMPLDPAMMDPSMTGQPVQAESASGMVGFLGGAAVGGFAGFKWLAPILQNAVKGPAGLLQGVATAGAALVGGFIGNKLFNR